MILLRIPRSDIIKKAQFQIVLQERRRLISLILQEYHTFVCNYSESIDKFFDVLDNKITEDGNLELIFNQLIKKITQNVCKTLKEFQNYMFEKVKSIKFFIIPDILNMEYTNEQYREIIISYCKSNEILKKLIKEFDDGFKRECEEFVDLSQKIIIEKNKFGFIYARRVLYILDKVENSIRENPKLELMFNIFIKSRENYKNVVELREVMYEKAKKSYKITPIKENRTIDAYKERLVSIEETNIRLIKIVEDFERRYVDGFSRIIKQNSQQKWQFIQTKS
ncbi:MAG: hypothetical protein PHY80_04585 [Rickettsiales bacterium]|nr:hypothetical protein [Rickettsiales bacterium]